jgi:hypothetical protein
MYRNVKKCSAAPCCEWGKIKKKVAVFGLLFDVFADIIYSKKTYNNNKTGE